MKKQLLTASITLCLAAPACALEFQPIGPIGVGGAGVARTTGALAPYWNPAGLAFAPKSATVSVTTGGGLIPQAKLAEDLDNLKTAHDAWRVDQLNASRVTDLATVVGSISDQDNLRAVANGALGIQAGHFGIGAFGTFEAGAVPVVAPLDTTDAATISATLADTKLIAKGIALGEVPISYGYKLETKDFGSLGLGLTAKYLYGEVTAINPSILRQNGETLSADRIASDLRDNRKATSSWGVDAGALWKYGTAVPVSLGIVGKNLNSPEFKSKDGLTVIKVKPQVRAGLSVSPLSWLELTGDIDVTENDTILTGVSSRQIGGGVEIAPFSCLKLRGGGYKDLETKNSAVTAGLTLGTPWVYLEVDGAYGSKEVRYDNQDYPSEAKAQASLNFAF